MYISNSRRVFKVILDLVLNPKHIYFYLIYSVSLRSPLQIELPWWSFKSIFILKNLLHPNLEVYEWGSGGSTIFLSKFVKSVHAVEHNSSWVKKIECIIEKKNIENIAISKREINLESSSKFLQSPYSKDIQKSYDLIVIDGEDHFGPDQTWSARENCFEISQDHINENGGIIVVDDAWRYPKILELSKAKKILQYESTGPCRRGVTRTDLHFY